MSLLSDVRIPHVLCCLRVCLHVGRVSFGFRAQAEAAKAGASKEAKGKKGGDDDD